MPDLETTAKRVYALEDRVTALEHRVVGVDGDNGINSVVKHNTEDILALRAWGENLWTKERPANCIGKAALAIFIAEHNKEQSMNVDMAKLALDAEKGRRDSRTTLIVALIGVFTTVIGPIVLKALKVL
jgi:hypothetical protein